MTTQQFKAWFEGFTEQMSGPPNELQWKRIKEKISSVQVGSNPYYPGGYPYYPPTLGVGVASGILSMGSNTHGIHDPGNNIHYDNFTKQDQLDAKDT